jgi:hypothetical protein
LSNIAVNREHEPFSSCIFTTASNHTLISNGFPPSNDDLLSDPQFAGLFQRLSPDKEDDVPSATDDYKGEQEALDLQNSAGDNSGEDDTDDNDSEGGEEDAGDKASVGFAGLKDVVKNASKGVTEETDGEYRGSEHNCLSFLLVCL